VHKEKGGFVRPFSSLNCPFLLIGLALALLLDRLAVWLLSPPSACAAPVPWFPRSLVSVLALALLLDRIAVRSAVLFILYALA
jgi:hypothetical protein